MHLNILFLLLILERGEGREKERERNVDVRNIKWLPPAHAQTRDWALTSN